MSTNTGRAPARAIVPAVAKKVNGLVMTSSPATDVERHERDQQGVGAGGDADAELAARVRRRRSFERLDFGAQDEILRFAHAQQRGVELPL